MSESHTSVSHDYRSDTSTSENTRLSFEQSPLSELKCVETNALQNNGMFSPPHTDICEVTNNGSDVEVKQEVVVEDSSVFLVTDEKSSILDDTQENEADSSDSGEPSDDTEKLSVDSKPQIMDCPQFIHSINAMNTNHVNHIQSEVDRSCQVPFTVTEGEITVSLANSDMWSQFDNYGTEMVLTKRGRRMFPYIEVNIKSGLELDKDYILLMDMKPYDDHRYKFHDGSWIPSVKADPPPVSMMYIHSDSPQKGSFWLSHTISFRKLKLTNCDQRKGHILLNTQHKYIPRLHIIQSSDTNNIISGLVSLRTFTFSRTSFVTVSTYKNFQITQLKVDNNPFAKHFRNSYHTTKRVMKIAEIEGIANASNSQYTSQPNALDSLQKQYPYIKHTSSNNNISSLHLENGTPPKTHALIHVDPTQTYTYTTNTPIPNNISQQSHIMHDQTSILTMMPSHNSALPHTQANIYFPGPTRKSPIQEGTNSKKIKLEASSHQSHPSLISLAQTSQIPIQVSQPLGIQNSAGSIQILTTNSNEIQPAASLTAQTHENTIITSNNLLLNNTKSHDISTLPSTSNHTIPIQSNALGANNVLPPGIQIIQDRIPSNIVPFSHPPPSTSSNPPIISNNHYTHANCTQDSITPKAKPDNATPTPTTYSLPNGAGSYMMVYLPLLLPCGQPNGSNSTSHDGIPPNIPILGSLPPGLNFNSTSLPTAVLSSLPPCVTP